MRILYIHCLLFLFILFSTHTAAQVRKDLDRSVPLWITYDSLSQTAELHWMNDPGATSYTIYQLSDESAAPQLSALQTVEGDVDTYSLGTWQAGITYHYYVDKVNSDLAFQGKGMITAGIETPLVHNRGRCLLLIDEMLVEPLASEIDRWLQDVRMDGWQPDTLHIARSLSPPQVKARIQTWYESAYGISQAVFILGKVSVPYSGDAAADGHTNHRGAWVADAYYAEMDGNWTDVSVNSTSASRTANHNVPGDGKFDQNIIPSEVELELGRAAFYDLPAFSESEIELTRQYLNKNHAFRSGEISVQRRALVENNFAGFDEGFGQSGWRNYVPMFGEDAVHSGNYEVDLDTGTYLCSYGCGAGSYNRMGGVGTTANLWASKNIQTVFTYTFGSYFGDWDNTDNFLRAALASGLVLTNAWAGRPAWHSYPMALGKHIGFCARLSQNARNIFWGQHFSRGSTFVSLLGDPTLRLHPMQKAAGLKTSFVNGGIQLEWEPSPDAGVGYVLYRKQNDDEWELIASLGNSTEYTDPCVPGNANYAYMLKAIRLEQTASGSYYNTSLGIVSEVVVGTNPERMAFYADTDMDGYGDPMVDSIACDLPAEFVENDDDCDDSNPDINPQAQEIPNNGIDEDCDGMDLVTSVYQLQGEQIRFYPNPVKHVLHVDKRSIKQMTYELYGANGQLLQSGKLDASISLREYNAGFHMLKVFAPQKQAFILYQFIKID